MKSIFKFNLLSVLLICSFAYLFIPLWAEAAAGINQTINFQGKIVNKTGGTNITDGTYSFTFKIFDASSGGNQLWSETQSSVSVTSGIFQVALGSVTPLTSVDFNQDNLWLDITFNGETFSSRIRFASAPQAINAQYLGGVVATQSAGGFTLTGGTSNLKALTLNDSTTFNTNGLTFAGGGGLTTAANKTLTVNNSITFSGGESQTMTLPSSSTTLAGLSIAETFTAAQAIQSNSATSFTVGANGATNPVLQIDSSAGSVATGLKITGAATGGTTALTVIDSGSNANLSLDAKGTGTITIAGTSTGNVNIGTSTTTKIIQIGATATAADTIILGNSSDTALKLAKFTTQNGVLYVSATDGTVTETAASTGTQCLITASAGVAPTWGSCSGSTSLQSVYNIGQSIDFSQVSNTAGLTLGTATGVGNILMQPNAGGAAAVIINKQFTSGDIFTASASGVTKFVISNAGNVGVGSSSPQQALTIGSTGNFATEMGSPTGATASLTNTGSNALVNGNYFYKITASDGVGQTIGSTETSVCTSASNQHTCAVSWTAVTGAVSYKIYRTSSSGSYTGTNFLTTVTNTTFSDDGSVTLTAGTPPSSTTAYLTKFSSSGASWLLGGSVGIGTTTPATTLHVKGGATGGVAAVIIDQIGASTNDILTASAAGTAKFIVHNDGSIQTIGGNGIADFTTITAGAGLKILPKANTSGAGGGLTLQSGNGSGGVGGNVTIDAGTGSTNGTISIGTANQSGITIGRSSAATTINGSALTFGGATGVSGALTVTSNGSGAFTVGANGSTNPVFQIDSSAGSVATGLKIVGAATGGTTALSVIDSGSNANLSIDAKGTGTITIAGTSTGSLTLGRATGVSGALTVTSNGSGAFTVGANGSTNPGLQVDASAVSSATGIKITAAAAGNGIAISGTSSGTNESLTIDAKGTGTITIGGTSTGSLTLGRATGVSGALTVTSNGSSALAVGANGSVNPVFTVDASTASVATGLKVLGAATGGTTAVSVTDSGSAANLSIDAKGTGTITIGTTSTGNITVGSNNTSTITFGGSNGLSFSTSSGPSYTGSARPAKQIVLSAEYPGAVLTASNSATINGNMTSDASPSATPTSYDWQNYYQWAAAADGSLQDYTIAIRVTLPKDFNAWAGGNCLTIAYNTGLASSSKNALEVYMYQNSDTSGIPVAFSNTGNASSKSWTTVNFTSSSFGGAKAWNTAGATAVIYLKLRSANPVDYVQVGDITLNYLAAF